MRPLVVGSLGPYGAYQADCSEYSGQYVDNMSIEVISRLSQFTFVAVESMFQTAYISVNPFNATCSKLLLFEG